MFSSNYEAHQYYLSSTKTALKDGYYNTRKDAERVMNEYCATHDMTPECVECDKHERYYETKTGATFCINRI